MKFKEVKPKIVHKKLLYALHHIERGGAKTVHVVGYDGRYLISFKYYGLFYIRVARTKTYKAIKRDIAAAFKQAKSKKQEIDSMQQLSIED